MLILRQDRSTIYNLRNYIRIDILESAGSWDIYCIKENNNSYFKGAEIASYSTKERCQEVLEDIIKKAEVGCNTYIMPEE